MITIKNTSRYPDDEVRKLVRLALADLGLKHIHVNVKNSSGRRRGRAYPSVPAISNAPASARNLITVGIGSPNSFPYEDGYWNSKAKAEGKSRRGGLWPEKTFRDWRDALVAVTAHEGKHVEQFRERQSLSELAAEHHAAWVLRRYQELDEAAAASRVRPRVEPSA